MNAQDLYHECAKCVGINYPNGMCAIPERAPVEGCGFFPVASGSFHNGSLTENIQRKLMFVGQDWGGVKGVMSLAKDPNADMKSATARNLHALLEAAGIPLKECFFTNALFGVRSAGKKITGPSPGWKDKKFCQRCENALRIQIQKIQPKAIVSLGRDAPDLLVEIVEKCRPWKSAKSFVQIDTDGYALIDLDPAEHDLKAAAILLHPSYRHIHARHRKFTGKNGNAAEIGMLNALWEKVK